MILKMDEVMIKNEKENNNYLGSTPQPQNDGGRIKRGG